MKCRYLPRHVGIILLSLHALGPSVLLADVPGKLGSFLEQHCIDCHEGSEAEGGLDLQSLKWKTDDAHNESVWVKIYDRVESGEMPPEDGGEISDVEREAMTKELSQRLIETREKAYSPAWPSRVATSQPLRI